MQTSPPSLANNVKLRPLSPYINYNAYANNFISLPFAEPSLGLPTGYNTTATGATYYFPVFGGDDGSNTATYQTSRRFTGDDSLIFKNNNIGYNNTNPVFNFDINGSLKANSAFINQLSAVSIVPNSNNDALSAIFPNGIFIKSNAFFDKDVNFANLTANNITVNNIYPTNYNLIVSNYTNYYSSNLTIYGNLNIGSLSANSVFSSTLSTASLSAVSSYVNNLTSNNLTVNQYISADQIFANNIHGKIDVDPFSPLYYNQNNQLSYSPRQSSYSFAVRPSDSYSTDSLTINRDANGAWDSLNKTEDSSVLRPYFKSIQSVFDYVSANQLEGSGLTIYIDEDIILGQNNQYTYTGNISGNFYTTSQVQPSLNNTLGGLFFWNKNHNANTNGNVNVLTIPPLRFINLVIKGRYDIGSRTSNKTYYSTSRGFQDAPRKIIARTYFSTLSTLGFNNFGGDAVIWNSVDTKNVVDSTPIVFNCSNLTTTYISNLCFEFVSNSFNTKPLVFKNGNYYIGNITISLLGNAKYTTGYIYATENSSITVVGSTLYDPYYLTPTTWNTWATYGYTTGQNFPGYGLALIGNKNNTPTVLGDSLITIDKKSSFELYDSNYSGNKTGYHSSILLDGFINGYSFYSIADSSEITHSDNVFITNSFILSSNTTKNNNYNAYNTNIMSVYTDNLNLLNFKFLNIKNSFNSFNFNSDGFATWTFSIEEYNSKNISWNRYNSNISVYNGKYENLVTFNPNPAVLNSTKNGSIDYTNSLNATGYINLLNASNQIRSNNTSSLIYYVNPYSLKVYDQITGDAVYHIKSPVPSSPYYTLNFYIPSIL